MPFLNTDKTWFVKYGLLLSSGVSYLKRKWKYGIDVKYLSIFNDYLMSILKSIYCLYRVSEFAYQKVVVIIIGIDNFILPNAKVIKAILWQFTFDLIKEYLYVKPIHSTVSWWDMSSYYNPYDVSKDAIYIIRKVFGVSGSYGSILKARCIVHNIYIFPRKGTRCHMTPM